MTGDHEVTLILQLKDANLPADLDEALAPGSDPDPALIFPFTVSYAAAEPVTSFGQFKESYLKTCGLFSYRLYFGPSFPAHYRRRPFAVNKENPLSVDG